MKYFLASFLIFISLNSFSQKITELQSININKDILVNGVGDEWPQPFQFADEKLNVAVCNNENYVYLLIQSFDHTIQQKIMRSGITLNLSTKGKDKLKLLINYPMRSSSDNFPPQQGQRPDADQIQERQSLEGRNLNLSENTTEMKVKGFKTVKGKIPAKNQGGLNAAIAWENENLITYELAIPIEEIYKNNSPSDSQLLNIDMKLQINAIPQPNPGNGGGGAAMSGGQKGGRSGGGGGGRSGGGGMTREAGASRRTQSDMFINTSYKMVVSLSQSK